MSQKTLARQQTLPAWIPYVAPLALFLVLTSLEGQAAAYYPLFYTLKIAIVGGTLIALRRALPDARPGGPGLPLALILGATLTAVWVLGDRITPHFAFLGTRAGFDPYQAIPGAAARDAFLVARFIGLVIVVPFAEELFYRGFLLRYVTAMEGPASRDGMDFRAVPLGTFSATALAVNVGLMALSHPEWLVAAVFSAAMCLLLARTRNLFACVLAHATTNLLLGVYVLVSHQWRFW